VGGRARRIPGERRIAGVAAESHEKALCGVAVGSVVGSPCREPPWEVAVGSSSWESLPGVDVGSRCGELLQGLAVGELLRGVAGRSRCGEMLWGIVGERLIAAGSRGNGGNTQEKAEES
jgi:hypothetical protein